ncbi:MAG: hypothetical protein RBR67_05640 [Desulfobacterium sp.]|nr:hypothetical protein [Desulfobacterium sp.]
MKEMMGGKNLSAWLKSASLFFAVFWVMIPLNCFSGDATGLEEMDLTTLSIEELMEIKVTSVSKKIQALSDSAAAIFVITNEDLKRSGVTIFHFPTLLFQIFNRQSAVTTSTAHLSRMRYRFLTTGPI